MERLTHVRRNGIKNGYWTPNKKEELVQRLAAYENTGLKPEEIEERSRRDIKEQWIPVKERLPEERGLYLVTCSGCADGDGKYISINHYNGHGEWTEDKIRLRGDRVTAWMPLPEPCKV